MYPAPFIKRRLVKGSEELRTALAQIGEMTREALTKESEALTAEDELVEHAVRLLTSKETTAEEISALLASDDFQKLGAQRAAAAALWTRNFEIAKDAYDRIDADVQALDDEIAQLEPMIIADTTNIDPAVLALKEKIARKEKKQEKVKVISKKAYRELKKKQQGLLSLKAEGAEVATEEVEPNAPLYCFCRRVGSSSMIGCDNEDCEFEWFHWECVGIVTPPTGQWYCKDCRVRLGMDTTEPEEGKAGGGEAGVEGDKGGSSETGAGGGEGAAAPAEPPAAASGEDGGERGQTAKGEEMEAEVGQGKEPGEPSAAAAMQEGA